MGYLDAEESFVVYPLPGGKVVTRFMDGTTDQELNFEFAMKSRSQQNIHKALWLVQNRLEELEELNSSNGSFEFEELEIINKPFINNIEEKGFFTFLLDVKAKITIFKED